MKVSVNLHNVSKDDVDFFSQTTFEEAYIKQR